MIGLEARQIVKSFGEPPTVVLKSVSLKVEKGDFVAVTGRSGSGKSTLLYMISGLDTPTSGSVLIDEMNIAELETTRFDSFRNAKVGFVFQFHYLLPELSALDNILMPARKVNRHGELRPRALELLGEFELSHCRDKTPGQMSGGEQQRTAIARALIMEPEYLFADEPTGNLDSINGDSVIRIFEEVNAKGTTILMVTHEHDYAMRAHRFINLVDGEISEDRRITKKHAARPKRAKARA